MLFIFFGWQSDDKTFDESSPSSKCIFLLFNYRFTSVFCLYATAGVYVAVHENSLEC